jgi:3-ketosteroid 9alpha-monooxygenase subunit A
MARFDFQGFARGWFLVATSEDIAPGEVKPLDYFGQHQVMFRTQSGEVRILDAFCPHLGAHLGHGGVVVGDDIRCPFHAWSFDGEGRCSGIPYASKIPPRAKIHSWPVSERDGMIFVWHDRERGAPDWEIPGIEDHDSDTWTPWHWGQVRIKAHPREIVENVVDVAHFVTVHGTHVSTISNEFDGHRATQINSGIAYPIGGGKDRYSLRATYHGPAFQLTEMKGFMDSRLVNAHVPVGPNELDLRFAVSLRRDESGRAEQYLEAYVENLRGGFFQDIEIWEHLEFRDAPMLCDGDGPVIKLRRWYAQFYAPRMPRTQTEVTLG